MDSFDSFFMDSFVTAIEKVDQIYIFWFFSGGELNNWVNNEVYKIWELGGGSKSCKMLWCSDKTCPYIRWAFPHELAYQIHLSLGLFFSFSIIPDRLSWKAFLSCKLNKSFHFYVLSTLCLLFSCWKVTNKKKIARYASVA